MLEVLALPFMQHAILAGVLASISCGMIGSLVVVNRLVFLAGGVAHTAYGGVGLAFFLGWPVLPTTLGFTAAAGMAMGRLTFERRDRTDAMTGVMWAAGMALGILLLDLTPGYNVDLMSYLFGSILTVPVRDLWLMAGLDTVVAVTVTWYFKELCVMSFDMEFAAARGVAVRRMYTLLFVLTALSVVMLIQVVGLILVIALLTIPSLMAERMTKSLAAMMVAAVAFCLLFCMGGLAAAYAFDLTSGACIIALACGAYFLQLSAYRIGRRKQ